MRAVLFAVEGQWDSSLLSGLLEGLAKCSVACIDQWLSASGRFGILKQISSFARLCHRYVLKLQVLLQCLKELLP